MSDEEGVRQRIPHPPRLNLTKVKAGSKARRWLRGRAPARIDPATTKEVTMKKLVFIALVVIAGLAVILDDGKPHPRMYRHH